MLGMCCVMRVDPLLFRKTQLFETILFVPSCKFIGRTFAFKKFYGVFRRGKERLPRFLIQPLLFRKTQSSSFQVASLSDEHSLLKSFSEFQKRGKERLYRFLNQPLLFRKTQPFQTSSFQVVAETDEHSLLKKFYGVSKEG